MNWPAPHAPGGIRLTEQQRIDWIRLSRTETIGPLTFNALINRFGGAAAALDALPAMLKSRGKHDVRVFSRGDAERELEAAAHANARIVALGEPDYPPLLRKTAGAPPLLAMKGQAAVLQHPFVAIVGSRNASGAGRSFTEKLARGLTQHGYAIVSGLARGIDTRAHEASLGFGTVAVLAGGIDRPYPAENIALLERLCETGMVISEMPFGWEPRGRDFPRRNRIISGIAYGTVIVEAARKSGSLITARFANEQGREVFAVPGSPLDPRAEGTNDLLRQGATLCASVDDVVRTLSLMISAPDLFSGTSMGEDPLTIAYQDEPLWDELLDGEVGAPACANGTGFEEASNAADLSPADEPGQEAALQRVLGALGPAPLDVDELARLAGISSRHLQSILLDLDLAGQIERHGGNRVSFNVSPASSS